MKNLMRFSSCLAAILLLAACGGGGGSSPPVAGGPAPPAGALDPGGAGLSLTQSVDGQGGSVSFSNAVDINNSNEVIGFVEASAGAQFSAALWTVDTSGAPAAVPSALSPISGNSFSAASALDEGGNAVGQSAKGIQRVAVLWPLGAGPIELPPLAAGGNSTAFGISQDGSLIVGEAQNAGLVTRAVIWIADASGNFTAPPIPLPVNIFASGQGVSSFSSAVGTARVETEIWVAGEAIDGGGTIHAALWRSADGIVFTATDLGEQGEIGSSAFSVNSGGEIVGESETSAGGDVPIRWARDAAGVFRRTAVAAVGTAASVNDSGRIAGETGASPRATVWNGTTPEALFDTVSRAYNLNDSAQPLVVGRNGDFGFVKRVD